ncbi:MAG: hypothetical protein Q8R47_04035 [Nanoarchaeota archaeon]|nr:hypothetical protein [Nanoarchaeota archaeon]
MAFHQHKNQEQMESKYAVPLEHLKLVFLDLDNCRVGYCLLRNFEFLFDPNFPWEGLDMVVCKEDFGRVNQILLLHGFTERKQQFSLRHRAYFKIVEGFKVSFDIQIGGVYWNDMKYIGETIIANRTKKEFFYVPGAHDFFLMLLVHSILGKRHFKPKYQEQMSLLLEQGLVDEQAVVQKLSMLFTKNMAKKILSLMKLKQFEKIPIPSLLLIFVFKKIKNITTFAALTVRWIQWKRPLMPAPLISIVGPDGAGKSTLVHSLHAYLEKNERKPAVVYMGRGRGHILPFTTLGRKYKSAEKKRDVRGSANLSSRRSFFYTFSSLLFVSDLLLRYWLVVFPLRMRNRIVVTDRYCTDIILMKNVPLWWKKELYSFFPKPTISILLYNTPEILHQRRPAETIQELQRQMGIFNKLRYDLRVETKSFEEDKQKVLDFVITQLLIDWY